MVSLNPYLFLLHGRERESARGRERSRLRKHVRAWAAILAKFDTLRGCCVISRGSRVTNELFEAQVVCVVYGSRLTTQA